LTQAVVLAPSLDDHAALDARPDHPGCDEACAGSGVGHARRRAHDDGVSEAERPLDGDLPSLGSDVTARCLQKEFLDRASACSNLDTTLSQ